MNRFNNKSIFITGAAGDLGLATAKYFRDEGADLFLADINLKNIEEFKNNSKSFTNKINYKNCDISNKNNVIETVEYAVKKNKKIDVLINNAAVDFSTPILDITEEEWDKIFSVNVKGTYFVTQAVLKYMINEKIKGSVINIASAGGIIPRPQILSYGTTKAAIIYMTKTFGLAMGKFGIRVNGIAPAPLDTKMFREVAPKIARQSGMTEKEWINSWNEKIPLGRIATLDDVVKTISFLASDESSFINAQIINVCGGLITN